MSLSKLEGQKMKGFNCFTDSEWDAYVSPGTQNSVTDILLVYEDAVIFSGSNQWVQ